MCIFMRLKRLLNFMANVERNCTFFFNATAMTALYQSKMSILKKNFLTCKDIAGKKVIYLDVTLNMLL